MTAWPNNETANRRDNIAENQLMRALQRTSVFKNLTLEQAKKLLRICEIRKCRANEVLYKEGSPSTDMFILLSGQLTVRKGGRAIIAEIMPVNLIGEMGAITGEHRSAQVVVQKDSVGLTIPKDRLDRLLRQDADLDRKILRNIINILCHKIREDGARLEVCENMVEYLEKQVPARSKVRGGGVASSGIETSEF